MDERTLFDTSQRLSDAFLLSELLVKKLSEDFPAPEVSVDENDGDLLLEWYIGQKRFITIWVRDGHVSWAGLCGDDSEHGRSGDSWTIPEECLAFIRRVTDSASERQA